MSHEPRVDRSTTASKFQDKSFQCPLSSSSEDELDMAEIMIKASREGSQVSDDDDQDNENYDKHKDELLDTVAGEGTEDGVSERARKKT
ncbi:hypothetical protein E4U14_004146 [Claviceps sp. LM454 group G7]|nr:hypothetical protein E4U14_004146 [Claviceps sp. LM454 group G7]